MKKTNISFILICCAFLLLFIGCGLRRVQMNVESYVNHDLNISEYKRFSFLPTNKEKPLMEKELFLLIKNEMQNKGYVYDDAKPQFLIAVQFGENTIKTVKQKPITSSVRPEQVYQPPPIGSKPGTYGTYQTQYITEVKGGGSYTETVNTRWMKIDFIDSNKNKRSDNLTYLWQGEVISEGSSAFNEVARCLIVGLLLDYPLKVTKPYRKLKYEECK